jgi:hypothetical protein
LFPLPILALPESPGWLCGGAGVSLSPPARSLRVPPTDCAAIGAALRAMAVAAKNSIDKICFRLMISPFYYFKIF